jgi:hypothetical protein
MVTPMKRTHFLFAALGMMAIAVAPVHDASQSPEGASVELESDAAPSARELFNQPPASRAPAHATSSPSPLASPVQTPTPSIEKEALTDDRLEEQRLARELAQLDSALAAQRVDARWAANAEVELANAVAEVQLANVQILESRCGATLCRLRLGLGAEQSDPDTYRPIFDALPWETPRRMHVDTGQAKQATAYVAREGHELPASGSAE